ncbi:hypothetical protein MKX03_007360 [Papaver bracteatum]|nr:hypothetical protein MKX03_007360 [Papaver bracteatum]
MSTNQTVESAKIPVNTAGEHVADAAKETKDYVADAANDTTNTAQQKKEEASRVLIADTAQTAREHVANAAAVSKAAKPEEGKTPGFLEKVN